MSRYVRDLVVAEFDKMVKKEYANTKTLSSRVRVKKNVEGATCRFQKSTQGMATKKVPQADVVPMNLDYSYVTATLEDWNAPEYTDVFDKPKVNFDEKKEITELSGAAVGRRETQIIIDSLTAGATTLTVAKTIGSTTVMNTAKFRDTQRLLNYWNVPEDGRTFLMSSEARSDMLGDSDADTFDKNAIKALVDGQLKKWLGFDIISIGYVAEGGLPKSGDTRSAYAWHKSCVGHAVGMNMRTEINYVPDKTSWLVNTLFSAGAIAIDAKGMVTISHDEQ